MVDGSERKEWAIRLERARLERFPTTWQAARALHALDPHHLPDAKTLHRYWSERWETGAVRPNRSHRELVERLLDAPGLFRISSAATPRTEAVGEETSGDPVQSVRPDISLMRPWRPNVITVGARHRLEEEVRMAADESAEHAAMSDAQIGERTVEQLQTDVLRLARGYSLRPLPEVFRAARQSRDLAIRLLDRTRRPSQLADLYVVAGQACGLLSTATFEMGYWDAASQFAGSTHTYADLAGHEGLRSWALGAQAIIANWQGYPADALDQLDDAIRHAPGGTATVRLRCIEARSRALLADPGGTHLALEAAESARASEVRDYLHDEVGGEFNFEPARQAFCAGSAYIHLGDGPSAERQARHALDLYAAAPAEERAYSAEYGARIDLVAALLLQGNLDGARDAIAPVFDLPSAQRVVVLTGRLDQVREMLTVETFRSSKAARQLASNIDEFTADTSGRALPPGDL